MGLLRMLAHIRPRAGEYCAFWPREGLGYEICAHAVSDKTECTVVLNLTAQINPMVSGDCDCDVI